MRSPLARGLLQFSSPDRPCYRRTGSANSSVSIRLDISLSPATPHQGMKSVKLLIKSRMRLQFVPPPSTRRFTLLGICALVRHASRFEQSALVDLTSYTAGWLLFWLKENFTASQVLVTINTAAHLFAIARLPPLTRSSPALLHTTHFVAKSIAGIGILDFIDNGGVAAVSVEIIYPPTSCHLTHI